MKTFRFCFLLTVFFLAPHSFAATESFSEVVLTPSLHFEASFDGEKVSGKWTPWKGDFMWYKVVRSDKNPDPIYPEDGHIFYSADITTNAFEDNSPLLQKTFYRLCVISFQRDRFCSNVVVIDPEKISASEPNICAQVITSARNPETGECTLFPTPCAVTTGWTDVTSDISDPLYCRPNIALVADPTSSSVELSWTEKAKGKVYILRSTQNQFPLFPVQNEETSFFVAEGQKFIDTNLESGVSYFYRLCFFNGDKCEQYSEVVSVKIPFENPFSDVSADTEMGEAILFFAKMGVVNGFDDGTFRAEKTVTRAELAKMATIATEGETKKTDTIYFCDVPNDAWFFPFVSYFWEQKFALGFPSEALDKKCAGSRLFFPHNTVLRSEAIKMILNASGVPITKDMHPVFFDISADDWVAPYAVTAHDTKIVRDDYFRPQENATRGEILLWLYRARGL